MKPDSSPKDTLRILEEARKALKRRVGATGFAVGGVINGVPYTSSDPSGAIPLPPPANKLTSEKRVRLTRIVKFPETFRKKFKRREIEIDRLQKLLLGSISELEKLSKESKDSNEPNFVRIIEELKRQLEVVRDSLNSTKQANTDLTGELSVKKVELERLAELKTSLETLTVELSEKLEVSKTTEAVNIHTIQDLLVELSNATKSVSELQKRLKESREMFSRESEAADSLGLELRAREEELLSNSTKMGAMVDKIKELEATLASKELEIAALNNDSKGKIQERRMLERQKLKLKNDLMRARSSVELLSGVVESLKKKVADLEKQNAELERGRGDWATVGSVREILNTRGSKKGQVFPPVFEPTFESTSQTETPSVEEELTFKEDMGERLLLLTPDISLEELKYVRFALENGKTSKVDGKDVSFFDLENYDSGNKSMLASVFFGDQFKTDQIKNSQLNVYKQALDYVIDRRQREVSTKPKGDENSLGKKVKPRIRLKPIGSLNDGVSQVDVYPEQKSILDNEKFKQIVEQVVDILLPRIVVNGGTITSQDVNEKIASVVSRYSSQLKFPLSVVVGSDDFNLQDEIALEEKLANEVKKYLAEKYAGINLV